MEICVDCGEPGKHDKHHPNKKKFPDQTVPLCQKCHRRYHIGLVLFRNAASIKYAEWSAEKYEKGEHATWEERLAKLKEFGYLPMHDGWELSEGADLMGQELIRLGWLE